MIDDPHVCSNCGTEAAKLRLLADFMDAWDEARGNLDTEVQDDLRTWADNIVTPRKPN